VRRPGEKFTDELIALTYLLGGLGIDPKKVLPPPVYYMLPDTVLPFARLAERVVSLFPFLEVQKAFLSPIRPEFLDFRALLEVAGERFLEAGGKLDTGARKKRLPRLIDGAININSGEFEAFDSWDAVPGENVTIEAVIASGTLPDVRHAQSVKHQKGLYWDGLYSQNPPVSQFLEKMNEPEKPDEIWVVRINPQKRDSDPTSWDEIEDRRNELAGNLSLNQELGFIAQVNKWRDPKRGVLNPDKYKHVAVYNVSMPAIESERLDVASKFDRDANYVLRLRLIGMIQGNRFMEAWSKNQVSDWTAPDDNGEPKRSDTIPVNIPTSWQKLDREIEKIRTEEEVLAKRCEELEAA
jgi:predicted acylesterase/phospholipase RssA